MQYQKKSVIVLGDYDQFFAIETQSCRSCDIHLNGCKTCTQELFDVNEVTYPLLKCKSCQNGLYLLTFPFDKYENIKSISLCVNDCGITVEIIAITAILNMDARNVHESIEFLIRAQIQSSKHSRLAIDAQMKDAKIVQHNHQHSAQIATQTFQYTVLAVIIVKHLNNLDLNTNVALSGCLQSNSSNINDCIACKEGYRLNRQDTSTDNCEKCKVQNQCFDQDQIEMFDMCQTCSTKNKCDICKIGYLMPGQHHCQLKCDLGYYPETIFSSDECISDEETDCLACTPNQYLTIQNIEQQTGFCQAKINAVGSIKIFVTSNYNPLLVQDGSINKPFQDLFDGVTRAFELGSQYTSAIINIYLFKVDDIGADSCLNSRIQCCLIKDQALANVQPGSYDCSILEENCQKDNPNSMFRLQEFQNPQLSFPIVLLLENVEIINIFYDMNSLIQVSEIENPLIKVKFINTLKQSKLKFLNFQRYPNEIYYQTHINYTNKVLEAFNDLRNKLNQANPQSSCQNTICFKIEITNSGFNQLHFLKKKQTNPVKINPEIGSRYQASVINLDTFKGDVYLFNSTFIDNYVMYDGGCQISDQLFSDFQVNNSEYLNYIGVQSKVQIKTLVSIRNHSNKIVIMKNKFSNNIAMVGILHIDLQDSLNNPLIIQSNEFTRNQVFALSNVIQVTKQQKKVLNTNINSLPSCRGILISGNLFTQNIGCWNQPVHGAISIQCKEIDLDEMVLHQNQINYIEQLDFMQYGALINQQSLLNIKSKDLYTNNQNLVITYQDIIISMNLEILQLRGNQYIENYASLKSSIVNIEGFLSVQFKNEVFKLNGNSFADALKIYSSLYANVITDKQAIDQYTFNNIKSKQSLDESYFSSNDINRSLSILRVKRAIEVNFENCDFSSNWIFDQGLEQNKDDFSTGGILLEDFYGEFNFNGINTKGFHDQGGVVSAMKTSQFFPLFRDLQEGQRTPLIRFKNTIFKKFDIINTLFRQIKFYSAASIYNLNLFGFSQNDKNFYDISKSNSYLASIQNCQFTLIEMINCEKIINLYHPNLEISNNQFSYIGGDPTIGHFGPQNLLQFGIYKDSIYLMKSNIFKFNYLPNGAIIGLTEVNDNGGSSVDYNLVITQNIFLNNTCQVLMNLNSNDWIKVKISLSSFQSNFGNLYSNEIYVGPKLKKLLVNSTSFNDINPTQILKASIIYQQGNSEVEITKSKFYCYYIGQNQNRMKIQIQQQVIAESLSPPLYFSGGQISLSNNQYTQCHGSLNGGVIYADQNSNITDYKSSYYENSAFNGGVFYMKDKATISIQDTIIQDNFADQSSVAVIDQYSKLYLSQNTRIIDNNAHYFATIYALSQSNYYIEDSSFQNCQAETAAVIYSLSPAQVIFYLLNLKGQLHKEDPVSSKYCFQWISNYFTSFY
ncbi:UNKNOWN [Stylonychia lemnae]|uniref:Uncharacterized protein n=1 Tax=Stylonychia lemnae TaxID=5949 RepID=A0A078A762_STYLE|nr:UNKNOWN [Stylonychia lemnae]|eukprot:CDW78085.1 UNKNOWN [Stylonychia lemnae]